jgi:hypothetical protein
MKYALVMVGLDSTLFNYLFTEQGTVKGLKTLEHGPGYKEVTLIDFKVTSNGAKSAISGDQGSGTITRYDNGTVDAIYEGSVMIGGERFEWQSIETGKVDKDGKVVKGLEIVTFPHSPKMNGFIIETEMDLSNEVCTNTVYEWK